METALSIQNLNILSSRFNFIDNPLVKTLSGLFFGGCNLAVKLWRETEVEFAGIWFVRIYASLFAVFNIFINDGMKALYDFRNRFSVKADYIAGIKFIDIKLIRTPFLREGV